MGGKALVILRAMRYRLLVHWKLSLALWGQVQMRERLGPHCPLSFPHLVHMVVQSHEVHSTMGSLWIRTFMLVFVLIMAEFLAESSLSDIVAMALDPTGGGISVDAALLYITFPGA